MSTTAGGPGNAWMFRHGIPVGFAEGDFSLGMVRDMPRTSIPQGGVYRARDFFVNRPGMVVKRGGTGFASQAVSDSLVNICAVAEFPGDSRLTMIGSSGSTRHLYDVTTGAPPQA